MLKYSKKGIKPSEFFVAKASIDFLTKILNKIEKRVIEGTHENKFGGGEELMKEIKKSL